MLKRRQLAAIMFTDVVGYTATMRENEQKAIDILEKNRAIQQPLIKQFNGTWIKEIGDAVLASFFTVSDALHCASAIQKACSFEPELKLRIGIHTGEILFENNDVFGDGVNIASRIQALAPAGGIWVTEAVHEIILNKKEFQTTFIGKQLLKNVNEPVSIYELILNDAGSKPRDIAKPEFNKKYREKSIAVLPFDNMSNDAEQEYFSDGIAEEIINSITHIKDLKVAGRMSSFQFKGLRASPREVGEKLGVLNVLEGSVRKQGNRIRITAQLINTEDGFHLWSEKYDRTMDDIFAIQDEIALAITEKLEITLLKLDRDKIVRNYTPTPEAYDLYLKGRFFLYHRGTSILTAINLFRESIEADVDFPLAYIGYADASLLLATYGLVSPSKVMGKAKSSAEKAIQLDPTLCEPYCTLGYYYNTFEWNWNEAKRNFLKSLELNPQYCQAHSWYGWNYLTWVEGNFEEAQKHGEILIKAEPLSATYYGSYSLILNTAGKSAEALKVCQIGIDLDKTAFLCRLNEGYIYMGMEEFIKALSSFHSAMTISNNHHFAVNGLIWTYCKTGEFDKARELMNQLKVRSETEYIANTFTGLSAAYLKNFDEAFSYLDRAFDDREPVLLALKYEKWGPLEFRSDPRFQKLLDRIGFPDYQ